MAKTAIGRLMPKPFHLPVTVRLPPNDHPQLWDAQTKASFISG
jgi:hypothetical protein